MNYPQPRGITINYDTRKIISKHMLNKSREDKNDVRKILYNIFLVDGKVMLTEYNENDRPENVEVQSEEACDNIKEYIDITNKRKNIEDKEKSFPLSLSSVTKKLLPSKSLSNIGINRHDYSITVPSKGQDVKKSKLCNKDTINTGPFKNTMQLLANITGERKNLYSTKKNLDNAKLGKAMALLPLQKYTNLNKKLISLKNKLAKYRVEEAKSRVLKQSLKKKINGMKNELEKLRNLKENLTRRFSEAQMAMLENPKKLRVEWTDADMCKVAILRQIISQSAYVFLKYKMNFPLPSLGAVRKWMIKNNMSIKARRSAIPIEGSTNLAAKDSPLRQNSITNNTPTPFVNKRTVKTKDQKIPKELQDVEVETAQRMKTRASIKEVEKPGNPLSQKSIMNNTPTPFVNKRTVKTKDQKIPKEPQDVEVETAQRMKTRASIKEVEKPGNPLSQKSIMNNTATPFINKRTIKTKDLKIPKEPQDVELETAQRMKTRAQIEEVEKPGNEVEIPERSPSPEDSGPQYLVFTDDNTELEYNPEFDNTPERNDTQIQELNDIQIQVENTASVTEVRQSEEVTPTVQRACLLCRLPFKSEEELTEHITVHYRETNCSSYRHVTKPYICEFCKKPVTSMGQLVRHHRAHLGINPLRCYHPGCSFIGHNRGSLSRHRYRHRCGRGAPLAVQLASCRPAPRPYRCGECLASCRNKRMYRRHMRSHAPTRPTSLPPHDGIACKCQQLFSDPGQHCGRGSHHERERDKHSCVCTLRFYSKEELGKHMLECPGTAGTSTRSQECKESGGKRKHSEGVPGSDQPKHRRLSSILEENKISGEQKTVVHTQEQGNYSPSSTVDNSLQQKVKVSENPQNSVNTGREVSIPVNRQPKIISGQKNNEQKHRIVQTDHLRKYVIIPNNQKEKVILLDKHHQQKYRTKFSKNQQKVPKTKQEINLVQENPQRIVITHTEDNYSPSAAVNRNHQQNVKVSGNLQRNVNTGSEVSIPVNHQPNVITVQKIDEPKLSIARNDHLKKYVIIPTNQKQKVILDENRQRKYTTKFIKNQEKVPETKQEIISVQENSQHIVVTKPGNPQVKVIIVPKQSKEASSVQDKDSQSKSIVAPNKHQRKIIIMPPNHQQKVLKKSSNPQEKVTVIPKSDNIDSVPGSLHPKFNILPKSHQKRVIIVPPNHQQKIITKTSNIQEKITLVSTKHEEVISVQNNPRPKRILVPNNQKNIVILPANHQKIKIMKPSIYHEKIVIHPANNQEMNSTQENPEQKVILTQENLQRSVIKHENILENIEQAKLLSATNNHENEPYSNGLMTIKGFKKENILLPGSNKNISIPNSSVIIFPKEGSKNSVLTINETEINNEVINEVTSEVIMDKLSSHLENTRILNSNYVGDVMQTDKMLEGDTERDESGLLMQDSIPQLHMPDIEDQHIEDVQQDMTVSEVSLDQNNPRPDSLPSAKPGRAESVIKTLCIRAANYPIQ